MTTLDTAPQPTFHRLESDDVPPPPQAAADLVAALGELEEPVKGGRADTGTYAYSYLELPDLLRAVRRVFAGHGLAVMQQVCNDAADVEIVTVILHRSGHTFRSAPLTLRSRGTVQDIGSAITYGRRYSLAAFVGLTGDDDDDAQRTIARPSDTPTPPGGEPIEPARDFTHGSITPGSASPASHRKMEAIAARRFPNRETFKAWAGDVLGVEPGWSAKDLSQAQVSAVIDRLLQDGEGGA